MTVELFHHEQGIDSAHQHGTPGPTSDRGADVIGYRQDDDGIELGSCKCYPSTTPAQIAAWSNEFLTHWSEYWQGRRVRKFTLVTAASNTASMAILEQIETEKARFRAHGITYSLWGPAQITSRLRGQRAIVATYLLPHWIEPLCGPAQTVAPTSPPRLALDAAIVGQIADLQVLLSDQSAREVDTAVDDLRAGRTERVRTLLQKFYNPEFWSQITAPTRAQILRLEGSLVLHLGDLDRADELDRQAEAEAPGNEPRLRARIAAERSGSTPGLQILGQPISIAGRQLQLSLLLASGDIAAARACLDRLDAEAAEDPETIRLGALLSVAENDRPRALNRINVAERAAGHWTAVQRSGVVIRYALAASPHLRSSFLLAPNPYSESLVCVDDEAQAYLRDALAMLDRLTEVEPGDFEDQLWRLAILCNLLDGHGQASTLAGAILDQAPAEPTVVAWCVQRNLDVDLAPSIAALRSLYEAGTDLPHVRALGLAMLSTDDRAGAANFLEAHLGLQDGALHEELQEWIDRYREISGDPDTIAFETARRQDDWGPFAERLDARLGAHPPEPFGLVMAEQAASFGRWTILAPWAEALLSYRTATAARIAIIALYNIGRIDDALGALERSRALFGSDLPSELRRLRIEALTRSGGAREALREASVLTERSSDPFDQLVFAEVSAFTGNLRAATPTLRKALLTDTLRPENALRWSRRMATVDRPLSEDLLRHAIARGIDPSQLAAAADQAARLGLSAEYSKLLPLLEARAGEPGSDLTIISDEQRAQMEAADREDVEARWRHYLVGAIPIHLLFDDDPASLLRLLSTNLEPPADSELLMPRLIRHGGRPARMGGLPPWPDMRIHLDVTGLFEVERLGLLDRLEGHPHPIIVSARLPDLLHAMATAAAPAGHQPGLVRDVIALIDARRLRITDPGERVDASWPPWTGMEIDVDCAAARLAATARAAGLLGEPVPSDFPLEDRLPETSLDLSQDLLVPASILLRLALSGDLAALARSCRLVIPEEDAGILRRASALVGTNENMTARAIRLAERIAAGVAAGTYRFLPRATDPEEQGGKASALLGEMLSIAPVDGGVAWFDDRNLSGYVHAETLPIVGTPEMIGVMQDAGLLTAAEIADLQFRLVASAATFLPADASLIATALDAAPIHDGRVIETEDLARLRRAFAATTSQARHLKLGPAGGLLADRPDEDVAIRSSMGLLGDMMDHIWIGSVASIEQCIARSDWAWSALRILRAPPNLPAADRKARGRFLAMQIARCLDKAVEVGGYANERENLRDNYIGWWWQRAIQPRLAVEPDLTDRIGDCLVELYRALLNDRDLSPEARPREREYVFLRRAQCLPPPIAERIKQSGLFARFVTTVRNVTIGEVHFTPAMFWTGMRKALRSGSAQIVSTRGRKLTLRRSGAMVVASGVADSQIQDDLNEILVARPRERSAALRLFIARYRLDQPGEAPFDEAVLRSVPDEKLMEILSDARSASTEGRYRNAERSLQTQRGAPTDSLRPTGLTAFASYFGVALDEQDPDNLADRQFATLQERHGTAEALRRISRLPLVPRPAWSAQLTDDEATRLWTGARTPTAMIAAIGMAAQRAVGADADREILDRLIETSRLWSAAISTVLRWTQACLIADPEWTCASPAARLNLIWMHAGWLLEQFIGGGFEPHILVDGLKEGLEQGAAIDRIATGWLGPIDQANPVGISGRVLLYHGLAAICDEKPVSTVLPGPIVEAARSWLNLPDSQVGMPHVVLLTRRPDGACSLPGYLRMHPTGLYDETAPAIRDLLIDNALQELEADPMQVASWTAFAALAHRGISQAQVGRLEELLSRVALFDIAFLPDPAAPNFHLWRGVLAALLASRQGDIANEILELARRCQHHFRGRLTEGSSGSDALCELAEISVTTGMIGADTFADARFASNMVGIANHWTDAIPALRQIVDNLLATASPDRYPALWELDFDLRRRG
ncbi:hypothetical protein HL653_05915 [Sphingomonas sp. AP4-R1]|uniref:hypothetical protein n=1 Tax=Sphingomonas sp. AP4-R1 TaxID=2735134 RepID=UPI0014938841|nr:hypothetical protein [Sphingomonas sp. AP4-R1]QJU57388.1 hypothetical protein HL653_05915 [Sphingomonas sp. AP4-R1]